MIQLSEEQQCILDTVKEGHNVMVDAVAGTGKTTLILSIAREMPDTKILQMIYKISPSILIIVWQNGIIYLLDIPIPKYVDYYLKICL